MGGKSSKSGKETSRDLFRKNMPSRPILGTLLWVTFAYLAVTNLVASLPLDEQILPDSSGEDHLSDNFVVCTSSADCYPISPSILISILGGLGENLSTSASENDVNIDIPQRRGISGSYLYDRKKQMAKKRKNQIEEVAIYFEQKKGWADIHEVITFLERGNLIHRPTEVTCSGQNNTNSPKSQNFVTGSVVIPYQTCV